MVFMCYSNVYQVFFTSEFTFNNSSGFSSSHRLPLAAAWKIGGTSSGWGFCTSSHHDLLGCTPTGLLHDTPNCNKCDAMSTWLWCDAINIATLCWYLHASPSLSIQLANCFVLPSVAHHKNFPRSQDNSCWCINIELTQQLSIVHLLVAEIQCRWENLDSTVSHTWDH